MSKQQAIQRQREKDSVTKKAITITVQVLRPLSIYLVYTIRNQVFLVFNQQLSCTHKKSPRLVEFSTLKHKTHPKTHLNNIAIFLFSLCDAEKETRGKATSERQEEKERDEMRCVCTSLFGKYTILCFPHLSTYNAYILDSIIA